MKNKLLSLLFLVLPLQAIVAENIVTDLYGFRIGQYRETMTNELGAPMLKDVFEDGYEYEVFLLKPDTSLYIVAEYAVGHTDVIWSLQISGNDLLTATGFKDLKMGMGITLLSKTMGNPSEKINIGEYGERWEYKNANYTFEVSANGILTSIKIKNTWTGEKPEVAKVPTFKQLLQKLSEKNNTDMAEILSPQLEIYYKNEILFFGKSWKTETETDPSKVFSTLRMLLKGLDKINTSDPNVYEENMRISSSQEPMHVIKINAAGCPIKEMVLHYWNGQYLVWEIKAE